MDAATDAAPNVSSAYAQSSQLHSSAGQHHRKSAPWYLGWGHLDWVIRGLLIVVCVTAGGLTILPALLGYQRYVITGISMTGSINKGSIAYDKIVPTSTLKVGDIITYTPPPGSIAPGEQVTHRIVGITKSPDGLTVYRTKGDFNKVEDPWTFHLNGAEQAKVVAHVPYAGYALALLAIRAVRMTVIGGIAALIALRVCISLWRDAGDEEVERKRAALAASMTDDETDADLDTDITTSLVFIDGISVPAVPVPVAAAVVDSTPLMDGDLALEDSAPIIDDVDVAKAAALAALIAASSAAASSRSFSGIHDGNGVSVNGDSVTSGNGSGRRAAS